MNKDNTLKRKRPRKLDNEVNRKISCEIRSQGERCLKQGHRILKKLNQVDRSIEIIAREIARQIKRNTI